MPSFSRFAALVAEDIEDVAVRVDGALETSDRQVQTLPRNRR